MPPPPADTAAPVATGALVAGATVTLTFDEDLLPTAATAATAFSVTVANTGRAVTAAVVKGKSVLLTLTRGVAAGDVVRVAYAGPAAGPLADAAGNKVAAFELAAANATPTALVVPTASSPCMLAQNASAAQYEASQGYPFLNEGPLSASGSLPTGGHVNAVVIAVDFPDAPATQDAAQLSAATVSALGRFAEHSYGRFTVSAEVVPSWRRMPQTASAYPDLNDPRRGMKQLVADATALVDGEFDFSNVDFVFVLAPGLAQYQRYGNPALSVFPGGGAVRDGNELRHATVMMRAFTVAQQDIPSIANHELTHSLGQPDVYQQVSGGTRFDLVGMWDPMSEPNPHHYLGWHKYRLGWIEADQLACLDGARQVQETLTPIEAGSGKKLVVAKVSASRAYVVEARRKAGLDGSLCREGVLVYTVDSQVANAQGAVQVLPAGPDDAQLRNQCGTLYNAPFQPGQTFEDANVKVTVASESASNYVVDVTRK